MVGLWSWVLGLCVWCFVLGALSLVLSISSLVPYAKYKAQSTKYKVPRPKTKTTNVQNTPPTVKLLACNHYVRLRPLHEKLRNLRTAAIKKWIIAMPSKTQTERRQQFQTTSGIELPAEYNPSNTAPSTTIRI